MVRKIIGSLGSLLADAQEQGYQPVMLSANFSATGGGEKRATRRSGRRASSRWAWTFQRPMRSRPSSPNAKGRWRPLLITAVFTGLRASELRGLRWSDVNLKANELHVRQRADRFNEIGKPKSAAGERVVPFGKFVANTLKEWKLACPKGPISCSPMARQGGVTGEHHQSRPDPPAQRRPSTAKPNTLACTRSDISMPRGASTGPQMAAWGFRPRWCKNGSATPRSP